MRHLTRDQMQQGEQLCDEELAKLSTSRLYKLFCKIRAFANPKNYGRWHRCCEVCKEWIGTDEQYQEEVTKPSAPFVAYAERLKQKLRERPDQFSHRKKKK